ncbi:MAG: hypothetical protein PF549_02770 [Patescibacteria group bacterium]|jgi:hypothetical protein|nr:hypothetical protein [Patescibacteria group bacterium]
MSINETKTIDDVRKRIERVPDIPDALKEKYYRGVQKRDYGYQMIAEVMVELQRENKWHLKVIKKGKYKEHTRNRF